jgi:PAS domain S-box-containing protein
MKQNIEISDFVLNDEAFFKTIFYQAGVGIGITDLEGTLVKVNNALQNMLSYNDSELIGMSLNDISHPDDLSLDKETIKKLVSGEAKSITLEKRYIKKNKQLLWARVTATLLKNDETGSEYCIGLIEDITDKKEYKQKYNDEKLFLETIMNHSPDSIYFKDLNSRFIKVDEGQLSKFGVDSIDQIIGKSDADFFSEEHARAALQDEQEIIRTEKPKIGIIEKETWQDGRVSWVSSSKMPLYNYAGELIGTFGISRDITPQKEIEIELKESQERYKNLSEVTFEGILIHDKGICIDANSSLLNLIGYQLDEVIGKNIVDLAIHKNYRKTVYENVINEFPDPYEVVVIRKDGYEFDAEIEARNVSFNGKDVRVAAIRDISKRKKQELVQDALYKISEAVSAIDDIQDLYKEIHQIVGKLMPAENFYIALYDIDSGMLTFPYFVDEEDDPPEPRKFGKGLTEYILRTDQDLLVDSEEDQRLRDLGETDLMGELSKIWLGVRLKVKGNLIGAIVLQDYHNEDTYHESDKEILTFVSEQIALAIDKKRGEDKLLSYSNELKELVASKDKFFSIVAHDLKSPFTALLGYSEMIANEYMEMTKEELKEFAVNMNDVAKKTFTLLENLLEWSRVQTGRMKYSPENVSLFKLSQQVVELYLENARNKGIVIKSRVYPEHEIYADSNMIFTILRNLVSNAVKFTKSNGEIVILSKRKNDMIEIKVKDNGVGMRDEDMLKLFRIDVHHSDIGTEKEKGTGLGLILCKELVEKNGGEISVQSELGVGSSFIFTLPISKLEI